MNSIVWEAGVWADGTWEDGVWATEEGEEPTAVFESSVRRHRRRLIKTT